MPILTEKNWQSWLFPTLRCPFGQQAIRINGQEWQLNKTLFAVCAAGRRDILEAWLPHLPSSELWNTDSILCAEGHVQLILTPLCMAALAGQTEVVELLLEHGAPLHEERIGFPSIWTEYCGTDESEKSLPLNPVLAGAIGNHWDTVRSLLARGAVCDWEAPEVQYIWNATHTNNLETTIRENLERSLKT